MQARSQQQWMRFQNIPGDDTPRSAAVRLSVEKENMATCTPEASHRQSWRSLESPLPLCNTPLGCLATHVTPVTQCIAASSHRRAVAYSSIPPAAHSCAYDSDADAAECTPAKAVANTDEEAGQVEVLLAEKDAELRQLAQRIERMEARRGAIDELQQLDALEARLKAEMLQKEQQIQVLKSNCKSRPTLMPLLMNGVAHCERSVSKEANKWALRALKALNLKPISPSTPEAEITTPAQRTPEVQSQPDARSPFFFSPWAFPPISLAKVRKGRFVVLTEGHAGADSAFCMGGEQLWLGKVEQRGPNSIQLLMYKPQRNAAGLTLAFEPCMDGNGYPVLEEVSLARRSILAIFDELERLQRGGVGILPEPTVEEIIKRLRHRYESSADENSPSLASWASPST